MVGRFMSTVAADVDRRITLLRKEGVGDEGGAGREGREAGYGPYASIFPSDEERLLSSLEAQRAALQYVAPKLQRTDDEKPGKYAAKTELGRYDNARSLANLVKPAEPPQANRRTSARRERQVRRSSLFSFYTAIVVMRRYNERAC